MGVYYADRPTDAMLVVKKYRRLVMSGMELIGICWNRNWIGAVVMSTQIVNADDLLRMPDEGLGHELVADELRERSKTFWCSQIAGRVAAEISKPAGGAGWIVGKGGGFQCFADRATVRRADAAFLRAGRVTPVQARDPGHYTGAPDLVVEGVGPGDKYYDLAARRTNWLDAGVRLVWLVYPAQWEVHAYRADGTVTLFGRTDTLTAEPVLPDFRVPVAELFRLPTAAG
jgi:Uma2 family endonuclease